MSEHIRYWWEVSNSIADNNLKMTDNNDVDNEMIVIIVICLLIDEIIKYRIYEII